MDTLNNSLHSDDQRLQDLNDDIAGTIIPAMIFVGLLMVVGIVGNLLVCFVFGFRLRMSTQHVLILTLAAFDLLTCFIAMPTEIVHMRYNVMFDSEFACRMLKFTTVFTNVASSLTLVLIAVDRYVKICRPLRHQMPLRHTKMALVAVLLVASVFSFPSPIMAGNTATVIDERFPTIYPCAANGSVQRTKYLLVYNVILFVVFLSLVVLLSVLYVRIWKALKQHNRTMQRAAAEAAHLPTSSPQTSSESTSGASTTVTSRTKTTTNTYSVKTYKATVVAVSVTLVYFLSFIPYFVLVITRTLIANFKWELMGAGLVSYHVFLRFPLLNSVANPFIYSALNSSFRAECSKLVMRFRKSPTKSSSDENDDNDESQTPEHVQMSTDSIELVDNELMTAV